MFGGKAGDRFDESCAILGTADSGGVVERTRPAANGDKCFNTLRDTMKSAGRQESQRLNTYIPVGSVNEKRETLRV